MPQSAPTWLCWPYLIVVWNWTCRSLCHHPLSNIAKQKNRVGVVNSTSKRLKNKLQCTKGVIGLKVYGQFQRAFINLVHTTNMYVPWSLPTTGTATRRPFCPIRGATLRPTETERSSRYDNFYCNGSEVESHKHQKQWKQTHQPFTAVKTPSKHQSKHPTNTAIASANTYDHQHDRFHDNHHHSLFSDSDSEFNERASARVRDLNGKKSKNIFNQSICTLKRTKVVLVKILNKYWTKYWTNEILNKYETYPWTVRLLLLCLFLLLVCLLSVGNSKLLSLIEGEDTSRSLFMAVAIFWITRAIFRNGFNFGKGDRGRWVHSNCVK